MREARLVGLSQDGKQLILAMAETGEEFAVPVDDRLRAALRGDRARLGQLEIQMESALRPRDIQARIRAGESPEAVAAVAQMPMERVMAFAGPVLAERDHIASLAQRASVRRRGGADAPTRNLGAWVTERLRTRQVDPAVGRVGRLAPRRRPLGRPRLLLQADERGARRDVRVRRSWSVRRPGRRRGPLAGRRAGAGDAAAVQPTGERRLTAVADIDLSLAPDHGADSYEAGFEDTISLPRRNHPVSRDSGPDVPATGGTRAVRVLPRVRPPGSRLARLPATTSAVHAGCTRCRPRRRADADRRTDRAAAGAASGGPRCRAADRTPGRGRVVRSPGGTRRCPGQPLHRAPRRARPDSRTGPHAGTYSTRPRKPRHPGRAGRTRRAARRTRSAHTGAGEARACRSAGSRRRGRVRRARRD